VRRVVESISFQGKEYKSYWEVESEHPEKFSAHSLEAAGMRALKVQRQNVVEVTCMGYSMLVRFTDEKVEEVKRLPRREPLKRGPKGPRKPKAAAPISTATEVPIHAEIVRRIERLEARPVVNIEPLTDRVMFLESEIDKLQKIVKEFRREYQIARAAMSLATMGKGEDEIERARRLPWSGKKK